MTLEELIREIEKLKQRQRFDKAMAESAPLLSGLSREAIDKIDLQNVVRRSKRKSNKRLIEILANAIRSQGGLR